MQMKTIDRNEFLKAALAFAGVGIGLTGLASCSNDNGPGTMAVGTSSGGTTGTTVTDACDVNAPTDTIAANHGHVLTVTPADASAAADKTYDIMFAILETGVSISTTSTVTDSHQHDITVVCA
jgi:hypothetical protein